ncbi:RNA helicase [Tulasnella sp. 418]|nr:RNA helicase [Tulasnella sp. 418]
MRLAKLKPTTASTRLGLPKSFTPKDSPKKQLKPAIKSGSKSGSVINGKVPPIGKNVFDEDYRHGIQARDPNNVSRRDVARMALNYGQDRQRSGRPTRIHNQGRHNPVTEKLSPNRSPAPASKTLSHHGDIQAKLKNEFVEITNPFRPASNATFSSPPLLDGLRASLQQVLGSHAKPTAIQALSMDHYLSAESQAGKQLVQSPGSETLLASETGSGKSFAYLIPLIQTLKISEASKPQTSKLLHDNSSTQLSDPDGDVGEDGHASQPPPLKPGPRAIILSPTHELARQLSAYAKSLCHISRLRVQCLSNPNKTRLSGVDAFNENGQDSIAARQGRPVDIMIGTPSKVLALEGGVELSDRTVISSTARTWGEYEKGEFVGKLDARMSLQDVEWVVIDEADVLFDRDFVETTRILLSDIKTAREAYLNATGQETGHTLPFHLAVCSATIPVSLSNFLEDNYPSMTRLVSRNIHRLPKKLQTDHVQWTGGHRLADIYKKIQEVWAEDATARARVKAGIQASADGENGQALNQRSKILIFCNEKSKVQLLAKYLKTEKGIDSLVMVGDDEQRRKGSNKHLAGFLKPSAANPSSSNPTEATNTTHASPSILITTSLLSRGLDFSPSIKHVFVVDEPRSAVDFLHRAGRTGRAGKTGTVVIFGSGKGSMKGIKNTVTRR